MAKDYTVQEFMDWVEVLTLNHQITRDEEDEPYFCLFVEGEPDGENRHKGIPNGFETAADVAERRITYYDLSVKKNVEEKAFYYGFAEYITFSDIDYLAANYYPDVIGRSLEGTFVIIGREKNGRHIVNPETGYSPEQLERLDEWLTVLKQLESDNHVLIINDDTDVIEIMMNSNKFVDKNGELCYKEIRDNLAVSYSGAAANIPVFTIGTLAEIKLTRSIPAKNGDIALLSHFIYI